MGKKYTTFLTLFTVICITLTGCERENEQTANQGRLNLKLAVDTNVENMVTRATADEETRERMRKIRLLFEEHCRLHVAS